MVETALKRKGIQGTSEHGPYIILKDGGGLGVMEDPVIKGVVLNDCSVKGRKYVTSWRVNKPEVSGGKCISYGLCVAYCPEAAVTQGEDLRPVIDYRFCKGCGICVYECPQKAIEMVKEDQL